MSRTISLISPLLIPIEFFRPALDALVPSRDEETSAHPSAPMLTLLTMAAMFYVQVASLVGILLGWNKRVRLARAGRAECGGNAARMWAALSLAVCLAAFTFDAMAALGGADGLRAMMRGKAPPPSSLVTPAALSFARTWAAVLCSLVVDGVFMLAAVVPCVLRTMSVFSFFKLAIYGPTMGVADGVRPSREPSLGSSAQLLRVFDVSDAVIARLLSIALLYALAKYGL